MTPGIDDVSYYVMVVRPYKYWQYSLRKKERQYNVQGPTYEDLLYNYYDYKEGLEDARAQADRWRHQ